MKSKHKGPANPLRYQMDELIKRVNELERESPEVGKTERRVS